MLNEIFKLPLSHIQINPAHLIEVNYEIEVGLVAIGRRSILEGQAKAYKRYLGTLSGRKSLRAPYSLRMVFSL